jgi:AcrR family transcriptional regulator
MPRPLGRRNPDYEEKRERLAQDLADFVLKSELKRTSFRQLAHAGAVAEPTLRHYFGDREGVAAELLRVLADRAAPFINAVAEPGPDLESAVKGYVAASQAGVAHGGFARAHMFGLLEGVADESVGQAYLTQLLEPSLSALEKRLAAHLDGTASPVELRAAALMIFAPMLLAVIHQKLLGGEEAASMDLDKLFQALGDLAQKSLKPDVRSKGAS